ncbi:hypothetical protein [Rhizobium sp. FY34]|uniref:hypothetical protein n=1 Tax=Rhizobium sp. FY34 TaxID=2562309 RepID=UPI0010BFCB0A|nr:hypothetical protein [Rhizobium sp. FY34]
MSYQTVSLRLALGVTTLGSARIELARTADTPQRSAMLQGFESVWQRLSTSVAPGEAGARLLLELLAAKGRA